MNEIDAKVYIEGILDCYDLTFSEFIQFCADNRLFEACALQANLKWWTEEESRCPKCGSSDIGEETYSWFDGDEVIVTKCQSCGFFAAGTDSEESIEIFQQGGIERGK